MFDPVPRRIKQRGLLFRFGGGQSPSDQRWSHNGGDPERTFPDGATQNSIQPKYRGARCWQLGSAE
jgi:hypothetical protein